ncbi:FHA domain-containing protein [Schaalia sp. 19OD2882]|uniref:FHA domain-containing protein n=1 Tax=Schaalia sp. 19OD2882 TaxID=2794089 RepID=UPI001C1EEE72|nr:FHA domain-containing protein [Schaalia sp. 19OD2882]QWW20573.1 FHA domain-containing protein [Schaalia sp. 19OD2882]
MLQTGSYSARGHGAMMVSGPTGLALVPEHLAPGAYQAVIGQADIGTWLRQVASAPVDLAFLDTANPRWYLTTRGAATASICMGGAPVSLSGQLWGEAIQPDSVDGIVLSVPGVVEGEWRHIAFGSAPAAQICIGTLPAQVSAPAGPFEAPVPQPPAAGSFGTVETPLSPRPWGAPWTHDAASVGMSALAPVHAGTPRRPEAFEAAIARSAFRQMEAEAESEAGVAVRSRSTDVPMPRAGFLMHAGSAPVELDRDVVIGRDPNPHALTGRARATPLRVPSPMTAISRSHCAVISIAPSAWAVMDLGSTNGTLLCRVNGAEEDVVPMSTVPLTDGDLIDVGEGVTIEFRVR